MGFEIDFLPVGEGQKSGDAVAVRHGNLHGSRSEQFVIKKRGRTEGGSPPKRKRRDRAGVKASPDVCPEQGTES